MRPGDLRQPQPRLGVGFLFAALLLLAPVLLAGCAEESRAPAGIVWRATCEPELVDVGDPIGFRLEGVWPDSLGPVEIHWCPPGDSILVVCRDSVDVAISEPWAARNYRMTLISPRTGRVRVPPVALVSTHGDTLAISDECWIGVSGRISEPEHARLAPLAPMVALRGFPWWLAAGGALFLAALVAAFLILRARRTRDEAAPTEPEVPPGEEFAEALRALRRKELGERGFARALAQELSWILRRYLGRRWLQPALEATRPEIVHWLPQTSLDVRGQVEVAGWLEETDRIKFGGHRPLLPEMDDLVARARRMVQHMEAAAADEAAVGTDATGEADVAGDGPGGTER